MSLDAAMDCPHCQTRNPAGAVSCSKCRAPLDAAGATLVGELTPPPDDSAVTLAGGQTTPPGSTPGTTSGSTPGTADDMTLVGAAPPSMAIPTDWSVPAPVRVGPGGVPQNLASLRPGGVLGNRYEILSVLGEGGMGAVYKARDRELDRLVAVKVIRPELAGQPDLLQRFKQELILARKVTQRNVIRIFDLGDADGIKFITMEYVEGHDLKSLLTQRGKLPADQAVDIVLQVCLALDAAHSEGVVHRDLKPQNIMIDQQGKALVMDFGIARSLEFGGMTQTGALIGTPEYMSPEQVRGEHVDARSDLFTLGIIFQEILTGKIPYQAETAMASMFKRTKERAIPVRQVDPSVPAYLGEIVAKCLEIDPNARFQSAREMIDALEAWKDGSAAPLRLRALRWMRQGKRGWRWIAAGALVVLLVVTVFVLRSRLTLKPAIAHAPVSVLVADFSNQTGDPIFDGTLEPMMNVALEGASFISAYNRGEARKQAAKLPNPTSKLDDQSARLVAINQGLSTIVTGSLSSRGEGYQISAKAIDAVTGKTLANSEVNAKNKDEVLLSIPNVVVPIRKALGDTTPESIQLQAAGGAFTSGSLEAVHEYGIAMEQQFSGNMEEAFKTFSKAAELDPNFARAYAGMAATAGNLGRGQDAEKYIKLAMEHVDRMTERERYRIRGLYYARTENWEKCIEEYSALVKLYPSDNIGQRNLATCYVFSRNMPKGMEEARKAVQLAPKDVGSRMNFALDACYSGDFQTCDREGREVQKINPAYDEGFLVLAYAQLGQGQLSQAAEIYHNLAKTGDRGASLAASGLANLALYEGRYRDAAQILEKAALADVAAKEPDRAADNFAMLAYADLSLGGKQAATAAAEKALANSQSAKIKFLAARIYVEAGETAKAQKLADALGSELQAEPRAYAKLIEGEVALKGHDPQKALQSLTEAQKLVDIWIVHLDLGMVYLEAGAFAEADSEFDQCIKRRGEVLELFMDDMPTYTYLPPVYYYQGRDREGLKSPGFADSYRAYLSIRGKSSEDPFVPEIRRRLGQ
jgi:tetratricopeptide (TPR) repeat protein/predicted Ser/Thr protein kinase